MYTSACSIVSKNKFSQTGIVLLADTYAVSQIRASSDRYRGLFVKIEPMLMLVQYIQSMTGAHVATVYFSKSGTFEYTDWISRKWDITAVAVSSCVTT